MRVNIYFSGYEKLHGSRDGVARHFALYAQIPSRCTKTPPLTKVRGGVYYCLRYLKINFRLRNKRVKQGGEGFKVLLDTSGEVFFDIFEEVVFGIHKHSYKVCFAVAVILFIGAGDFPVRRLEVHIWYALVFKTPVVAPIAR